MPKQVYLIRHGETDGTAAGHFSGSTDLPLTTRGLSQVQRLAQLLSIWLSAKGRKDEEGRAKTWCVASPLLRAQQTAAIVAGFLGLSVVTDPDLREMSFGAWEGLTAEEIESRSPGALAEWISPAEDAAFPGGESLAEFERRMARARDRILATEAETVLVFTHGGVVRALACDLIGLGREAYWVLSVQPASVVCLDVFENGAVLSGLWSVSDWEAVEAE